MNDTMTLKNGTVVELKTGASLDALQVAAADREAMLTIWEQLTPDNLSEVTVKNGSGLAVGNYTDLVLVSETSIVAADGSVLTTYRLREKTAIEKRLDALETGQEVQGGAIADLGEVTSVMAGQLEGGVE